jgi:hypothetical protein
MPDYRAYLVGGDGHFFDFKEMVCDDDAEALERARQIVDGHDVELWSGARLVELIKHNQTSNEVRAFERQLEQSRRMSKGAIDSVASARFDQLTSDLTRDKADQQRRDDEN